MCQSSHAMYEGKNIHYSAVDNKPLCSFSSKLCNQRRLNGYAFCVRHILEDPTAPFKRCAYVAKSSNQMCTQPIPQHEERLYCNNHMQVLGMLPRKERKKKEKEKEKEVNAVRHDNKVFIGEKVKAKYTPKIKNDVTAKQLSVDDPDDPYAFPDPVRDTVVNNVVPQQTPPVEIPKQPQQSPNRAKSPGDGGSTIAKLYPELAEKLEKIKPKVEPKLKGRIRSSRTMNKLQTKIAQNKIKDKLRKSQESGSNPSVSPVSVPSPDPIPVPSQPIVNFTAGQQVTPPHPPFVRYDGAPSLSLRPPIPPPVAPANLTGLSDVTPLSPLAARLSSQVLPPPYPGSTNQITAVPSTPVALSVSNVTQHPHSHHPQQPVPQTSVVSPPIPEPRLPPPPPYVAPSRPSTASVNSLPVLPTGPQRLKDVIVKNVECKKLKTNSTSNFYSYYAKRKKYNHHYVNSGLCSSSDDESDNENFDMLPFQPGWFSASSDEDNEEEQEDELPIHLRATKLALLRAKLRRLCCQSRKATCSNTVLQSYNNEATLALIKSARDNPVSTVKAVWEVMGIPRKPVDKYKRRGLEHRPCLYKNDEDEKCDHRALPFTNHCLRHIMYNVDQQLFDYCTAKFADNTQCCVPVFDIRHGLPLCAEHGAKLDYHQKSGDFDVKKRPRKKTKPPALTRPPKKGKKKKKNRPVRPQKPIPPSEPMGDTGSFGSLPVTEDEKEDSLRSDDDDSSVGSPAEMSQTSSVPPAPAPATTPLPAPAPTVELPSASSSHPENGPVDDLVKKEGTIEDKIDIDNALSNVPLEMMLPASGRIDDIAKSFGELPLEQASRLLEEGDLQDVLNKLPDDAFDIFTGKNGECVPTMQETEELERALADATNDVYSAKDMLEKVLKGEISDDFSAELTRTLTETLLAQSAQSAQPAMEVTLGGETLPTDIVQGGINAFSRNLTVNSTYNPNASVPVTTNSAILSRLQGGVPFSQTQTVTVPYNGAVTSGTSAVVGSTNIAPMALGFQNAAASAQSVGSALASRTTIASQRGLPNSQGVTHAGYHGNLPYSALSQQLAMSQQTPKEPTLANSAPVGQLHTDTARVLTHSNLPQQQQLHSQTVIPPQMGGSTRPAWQSQLSSVSGSNVNFQNGFPGPVTQAPFIHAVNITNQVGKFPVSAQTNMTSEFAGKQDPHFAAASLPHSIGVAAIRPPVQGFVTNFASGIPPFTSSSNGS